jgi:hypothetical protein
MDWIEVKKGTRQMNDCVWVECIAEIRKNDTGEIRQYETHEMLTIGDKHPSIFNWKDNNYSCDCNRLLFFNRAKEEEKGEDWDVECTDGKFSVNLKNKKDGIIYYREYDV